jgi:hypothetical protein
MRIIRHGVALASYFGSSRVPEENSMRRIAQLAFTLFAFGAVQAAVAAPIFWTDWTGSNTTPASGFTGQGTITTTTSTVNVTYSNPQGIAFYQTGASGDIDYWQNNRNGRNPATSPYTSTTVDNIPTGTDIIALQFAGTQTLTFSQAIANPVFGFVSLNGNGYAFLNQDFNILSVGGEDGNDCGYWGCGGVTKTIVDLGNGNTLYELNSDNVGGLEPHGVIQFTGAFDSLTWESASNEFWNGFTVGVQGTAAEVFPPSGIIPEPDLLALFGIGVAAVAVQRRRAAR